MGTDDRRVAIVIPSWNCMGDLPACIDSIRAQRGVEIELLVVDNGSEDGTVAYLEREGVEHVALPRNLGFAVAVNLGISRVESDAVLVLNADTVLEPDCVRLLVERLDDRPELGGVQPRILALERGQDRDLESTDTVIYSLGQALTADGRAREQGAGMAQGVVDTRPREVFGVCGAASLLRREMVRQLGGYDERYFAFYEDVDLNIRARALGWSFELVPGSVAWHVGNASWHSGFERPDAENARLVARNRAATQLKFMPLRSLPRILAVEVGALLRAIRSKRLMLTASGKLAALLRSREYLKSRRRLAREGDLELARAWLGESRRTVADIVRSPIPPMDPREHRAPRH